MLWGAWRRPRASGIGQRARETCRSRGAGARPAGSVDDRGDAGAGARGRRRLPVPVPPGHQAAPGPARLGGWTTGEMLVWGYVAAGAGLFRCPRDTRRRRGPPGRVGRRQGGCWCWGALPGAPACSGAPGTPGGAGARQAGWADDRGDAGAGARCRRRRPVPVPPGRQAAPGPARLGGLTTGGMLVRGCVAAGAGLFRCPRDTRRRRGPPGGVG